MLKTRPVYPQNDTGIRGHLFSSFLALIVLKELLHRLEARGVEVEWGRLRNDLESLEEVTLRTDGRRFVIRTPAQDAAGHALNAAGAYTMWGSAKAA